MDRYLINKFKDIYRVRAKLDQSTDDFVKDADGNLDESFADFYIKCRNGFEIYHYYRDIMGVYNENPSKGRNLIRAIYEDKYQSPAPKDYKRVVDKLLKQEVILSYLDTEQDFDFHFKAADIDYFVKFLKPETTGASISPFSLKNLPKNPYTIPNEDLQLYDDLIKKLSMENAEKLVIINQVNSKYKSLKQNELTNFDFGLDMRNAKLKFKPYVHHKGWWSEYIIFLQKELQNLS